MVEEISSEADGELPLEGVGQKLRRAREGTGLSVEQLAEKTRIAQRHIELIEAGNFDELPARTYAFGFSRTFARVVGLDENAIVAELRAEMASKGHERPRYTPGFEPGDPAKLPPAGIVWASAIAVLLLAVGTYVFYSRFFAPGADPAPLVAENVDQQAQNIGTVATSVADPSSVAPAAAPAASPDEVAFTAMEDGIWVSFYEASGRRLLQKLMERGERFVVPAEARDPRIWTGRPDALAITVGGREVPRLAQDERVMRDVSITAEALRTRAAPTVPEPAT